MEPTADGDYARGPCAVGAAVAQEVTRRLRLAVVRLLTASAAFWLLPVLAVELPERTLALCHARLKIFLRFYDMLGGEEKGAERRSRYHGRAGVSVLAGFIPTRGNG